MKSQFRVRFQWWKICVWISIGIPRSHAPKKQITQNKIFKKMCRSKKKPNNSLRRDVFNLERNWKKLVLHQDWTCRILNSTLGFGWFFHFVELFHWGLQNELSFPAPSPHSLTRPHPPLLHPPGLKHVKRGTSLPSIPLLLSFQRTKPLANCVC